MIRPGGGTSSGSSGMTSGHSYDRPAASANTRFLDTDSLVVYTSRAAAWGVEIGCALGADTAGLLPGGTGAAGGTISKGSLDLSAYTIGLFSAAGLFFFRGPIDPAYSVILEVGAADGSRGIQLGLRPKPGDATKNELIAVTGAGPGVTVLKTFNPAADLTVGLHAVAIAAVDVLGTHTWRWSWDGAAAVDTAMVANYVTPITTDEIGFGSRSTGYPLNGEVIAMAVYNSLLSGANLTALATLPGTPTYRLPFTAITGVPTIWCEAARYSPTTPLALQVYGLTSVLSASSGVTKVAY